MIATGSSAKTTSAAAAGALGSKSARACDGCLRRRARWYCAADDAFLCQGCDTSVHSANPLARRHERLRLQPSSSPLRSPPPVVGSGGEARASSNKRERRAAAVDEVVPAWFRRKARTPRPAAANKSALVVGRELSRRLVVVPETTSSVGGGNSPDDGQSCVGGEVEAAEEEQLLYRVPVFDPALAEFCSPPPPLEDAAAAASSCCNEDGGAVVNPTKHDAPQPLATQFFPDGGHASFEPTDAELREFAADMEALLGRGLDDGNEEDSSFYMETLGLLDHPVSSDDGARVKVEAEHGGNNAFDTSAACHNLELDLEPEPSEEMLDIDFDYGSPTQEAPADDENAASSVKFLQRSLSLTLNYEAIIQSWGSSPWTGGGDRPHVKLDDCWPQDYTGMWAVGGVVGHGGEELLSLPRLGMDGGREARVSRYREKRRTRLFSKKIRYEVRKLNAEKRPRMKGRFVKRATAGGVAIAGLA